MNYHNNVKKSTWASFCAQLLTIGSITLCVLGIILYSIDLYRHGKQKHYIGWFSSGGFVLLTIPISIRIIVLHLTHWYKPQIQKYIVRIVWMIPIYAIESWLALRFKVVAIYFERLRESYESYVILCFLYYLIALLGNDEEDIIYILSRNHNHSPQDHHHHHLYVMNGNNINSSTTTTSTTSTTSSNHGTNSKLVSTTCCYCYKYYYIQSNKSSSNINNTISTSSSTVNNQHTVHSIYANLLHRCKIGVFQYVFIKNFSIILISILQYYYNSTTNNSKIYTLHLFRYDYTSLDIYIYLYYLINNLSQCWALYSLIEFYHLTKDELIMYRPLGKFLCVKTVVFFTWWQSILIDFLFASYGHVVRETEHWTVTEISKGLQVSGL
jgi:hypothetical protein